MSSVNYINQLISTYMYVHKYASYETRYNEVFSSEGLALHFSYKLIKIVIWMQ